MVKRNIITIEPETQAKLISVMTEQPFRGGTYSTFLDEAIAAFRRGEWRPVQQNA